MAEFDSKKLTEDAPLEEMCVVVDWLKDNGGYLDSVLPGPDFFSTGNKLDVLYSALYDAYQEEPADQAEGG